MKKQVISLFLAFGISLVAGAQPQEKRRAITLEEAITIARVQSVDAAVALKRAGKLLIGNIVLSVRICFRK